MATKDTVVQELVINTLTQAQFDAAKEAGTLSPYELYGTPDTSVRLPVLTPMWFDHIANDVSWLRADTFSWQSGDVYVAAYNHLADDMSLSSSNNKMTINGTEYYVWDGGSGTDYYTRSETPVTGDDTYMLSSGAVERVKFVVVSFDGTTLRVEDENTGSTSDWSKKSLSGVNAIETIGDITIQYYQTEDGHKICMPDQESNVSALYEATGVAWYYILDTDNKQFKLPRTKWGFTGLRDSVGGYVAAGLPNITGEPTTTTLFNNSRNVGGTNGAFTTEQTGTIALASGGGAQGLYSIQFDASDSNSVYGASDTVQPPATQMYLYFYVGNFEQDSVEQTAGVTSETLNGKLDIDVGNATDETKAAIVGWGMPDYSAGVVVADGYQTTFPCFVTLIHPATAESNSAVVINVDGARVALNVAGGNISKRFGTSCYVDTGHTITIDGSDGSPVLTVYPLKGVN